MGNVTKKYTVSKELVDAINDLPPTYTQGDDGKYDQFVPDQETEYSIQRKLDRVDEAERKFNELMNTEHE